MEGPPPGETSLLIKVFPVPGKNDLIHWKTYKMMSEDISQPEVEGTLPSENRNSAATIDHTEVHIDVTKKTDGPAVITSSNAETPGVKYSATETGQTTVVVQTKPDPADKPKDFVVTSCFVIMLCNFCWGLAGWHFGLKANYAWQLGDEVECRKQAKRARIFVILGVITGILTWVLSLVLFFTLSPLRPGA
ncbi:hypothetical protein ACF0H5_014214 [Mactra antiquata]